MTKPNKLPPRICFATMQAKLGAVIDYAEQEQAALLQSIVAQVQCGALDQASGLSAMHIELGHFLYAAKSALRKAQDTKTKCIF